MNISIVAWMCALLVASTLIPQSAHALVPRSDRVIRAVAGANKSGHRAGALRFTLNLRIGDGPPVAVGELITHPTGLARLELRASGGLVERHILLGDQHSAARNARLLLRPREFLPPLFVLQSDSSAVLGAALETLGVDRRLIGLAPCGDFDCYVIGDPDRAVEREHATLKREREADETPEPIVMTEGTEVRLAWDPQRKPAPTHESASLWVDTIDHSIRQIESRGGVKVVLGPYVTFERLSVPSWWSVEEPGKRIVHFEVEGVVEVNAPMSAFSKAWLMSPVIPTASNENAPPQRDDEGPPSTNGAGEGSGAASPASGAARSGQRTFAPPVSSPPGKAPEDNSEDPAPYDGYDPDDENY